MPDISVECLLLQDAPNFTQNRKGKNWAVEGTILDGNIGTDYMLNSTA